MTGRIAELGTVSIALVFLLVAGAAAAQQVPVRPDAWPEHAVTDEEAGAAARRPMRFTQKQIAKLAELVRQYQRATAEGAGPAPSGRIRRALVEPGRRRRCAGGGGAAGIYDGLVVDGHDGLALAGR